MKDKLLQIINHYGINNQLKYIHSEYYELNEAILDYISKDENKYQDRDHIAEEIACLKLEIERLNNIIDELEKYLEKIIIDGGTRGSMTFWYRQIYEYLQELKEGKE